MTHSGESLSNLLRLGARKGRLGNSVEDLLKNNDFIRKFYGRKRARILIPRAREGDLLFEASEVCLSEWTATLFRSVGDVV